jgi:hypothetical protein
MMPRRASNPVLSLLKAFITVFRRPVPKKFQSVDPPGPPPNLPPIFDIYEKDEHE